MARIPSAPLSAVATALLLSLLGTGAARAADTVVQIPMGGLLDRRSATVLQGTTLVVFNLTIDGGGGDIGTGGLQNGFATQAVAKLKGTPPANCLPDDGKFAADARHPEVVLHVSNDADAASGQSRLVPPTAGMFTIPMPSATYSKVFLFFHGANGGTTVKMTLTYSDATTQVANAKIPDFFSDPTDPAVFILAKGLAKWSKTTTIAEADHHNLFGIEVAPMAKTLTSILVERGTTGYLVFWGATGIATTAVTLPDGGAGPDASSTGDAKPADATGAGGSTGAGGTTSAAGTGGGAGTAGGAAGTVGAAGTTGAAAGTSGGAAGTGAAGTTSSGAAGTTGVAGSSGDDGGGCGCRFGDTGGNGASSIVIGALGALWVGRRRRRR